jgi:hypothetical protein
VVISAIGGDFNSLKWRLKQLNTELTDVFSLKPHERVDDERIIEIRESIVKGGMQYPIVVDRESNIILDGHHRFNIFKGFGIRNIPVFYVDYSDDRIILDSWNGQKLTKSDIVEAASSGKLFPNKTTKHMFISSNGLVHISSIVPRIDVDVFKLKLLEVER